MIQFLKCPAKVNLGLRVLERRPDGYHELRTVFQTIGIYDRMRVEVEKTAGPARVDFSCNVPELNTGSNLAARAARAILDELKVRRRARIVLDKIIPAGSGLGGGSSDAAAILLVLPGLLGRALAPERQFALAADLGADVPFFLLGGRAIGLGRGTEVYPLPDSPNRYLVVVHPGLPVSTAEAYQRLDRARQEDRRRSPLDREKPEKNSPAGTLTTAAAGRIISSFSSIVSQPQWDRLKNDFEPVVFSAHPELARLKRFLARAGATPTLLCGSGSAMFGMFDSAAAARQAAERVRRRWPEWRVWVTRTVSRRQLARVWNENERRPIEDL